ncbi:pyridoxal-phosphate dependent enzyme [Streptomyces sp. WMMC500]|uniref:threonine ammonia-lyase n=1 Tax=Streptomyces sp. WMMC500 TaxID=3015154 RepID=UPI00248C4824|nr:pyridoxal-phosphate dependent enzyme [Streptomyces sp. WMMC500]WBB57690.1 pyridoxal-phosphate dependent enzyme [Streptomyces sp. WMMC500]
MIQPLQVQNIEEAAGLIDPVFRNTPYVEDTALARRVGRDLGLKLETFNPIRSFKGRGADYFMREVAAGQRVVCASAGNFGQAIAYAGRARGIAVTVFCARSANPVKVARMRGLDAEVVLAGDDFDAAKDAARAYADGGPGRLFVEDGREARISEGAGTIAVELAPLKPATLLVPLGNGALIGGTACWTKARAPRTRVVGVCAAGAPSMAESWRRNAPFTTPEARTIADGVAVRVPVSAAVDRMRGLVDDVVLVDDDQIREALRALRDTVGLILEPSAALGVAAALHHRFPPGTLATVVTGSNFSPELLAELR